MIYISAILHSTLNLLWGQCKLSRAHYTHYPLHGAGAGRHSASARWAAVARRHSDSEQCELGDGKIFSDTQEIFSSTLLLWRRTCFLISLTNHSSSMYHLTWLRAAHILRTPRSRTTADTETSATTFSSDSTRQHVSNVRWCLTVFSSIFYLQKVVPTSKS